MVTVTPEKRKLGFNGLPSGAGAVPVSMDGGREGWSDQRMSDRCRTVQRADVVTKRGTEIAADRTLLVCV